MDIATILGLLLGSLVLAGSVYFAGAKVDAFIDFPALLCVLGGTTAAVLVTVPLRTFLSLGGILRRVLFHRPTDTAALVEMIVGLAEIARRDGLLALESRGDIHHPLIQLGMQMAVDGSRADVVEEVLRGEIEQIAVRQREGKQMLEQFGRFAPAFGMIGTLLGLVMMLGNMNNAENIGPGMAVALLTTLYGAVAANVIFLPLAEKLNRINKHELAVLNLAVRGILSIQAGDNPRVVRQKLRAGVTPHERTLRRKAA